MRLLDKIRKVYIYRRIRRFESVEGWLSAIEAIQLYRIASQLKKNAVIVEIGSWKGRSTLCLARGLKKGKLFAIDPFDASGEPESSETYRKQMGATPLLDQFRENMKSARVLDEIEICAGYSQQFAGKFKSIDLLFIDGDHSIEGCDRDFALFSPALVRGGYLLFHDYDPARKDLGPTWVIEHRVLPSPDFSFVGKYDTLWVAQKVR